MQQFCQKIGENVGVDLKLFTVFLQSTHCVQWTSHHHRVLDERRENRGARTLCAHTHHLSQLPAPYRLQRDLEPFIESYF